MQRAFIGGVLAAGLLAVLGVFMVLRRLSLLGDGIAHLSFAGVAAGLFLGINPLVSAAVASFAGVLGIQELQKRKVYGDAAIAILFSLGLAGGIILISLARGFNADLFSYLFGNILAISESDLYLVSALAIISAAVLAIFYKEFFYLTLSEDSAQVSGLPVKRLNTLMLFLIALVVVSAIKLVGILLVTSLAVIPASTALLFHRSFRETLAISAAISVASTIVGLFVSYYLNIAPSGSIVLIAITIFLSTIAVKRQ